MNQMMERKRLRREYLLQKTDAYMNGTVGCVLFIPATLCFIASVVGVFASGTKWVTLMLILAGLMGCFTKWCWKATHEFERAVQLPFVPPVTADTLPAEEILVRTADEPPVSQSTDLLRAAQVGQETPKEELLRMSQGE